MNLHERKGSPVFFFFHSLSNNKKKSETSSRSCTDHCVGRSRLSRLEDGAFSLSGKRVFSLNNEPEEQSRILEAICQGPIKCQEPIVPGLEPMLRGQWKEICLTRQSE